LFYCHYYNNEIVCSLVAGLVAFFVFHSKTVFKNNWMSLSILSVSKTTSVIPTLTYF
jgi:hypothetical protein